MHFSNRFGSTLFCICDKKGSIPEILVSVSRAQTHRAAQRIHIADRGVLSMREREARARFLIQGPSKKEQAHCSSYKWLNCSSLSMANSSNISKTAVPVDISYAQFYIVFIRTQYHWHGIKAGVYCRHCSPIFSKEEDYIQRYEQKGILGADLGGGRTRRVPPLKLEKIWFFGVKSWFFTRNTQKIFAPPSAIGKNMIFGVKSWFFTRNTPKIFAPPSARCDFFKCASLNLKSWIRPCISHSCLHGEVIIKAKKFKSDTSKLIKSYSYI